MRSRDPWNASKVRKGWVALSENLSRGSATCNELQANTKHQTDARNSSDRRKRNRFWARSMHYHEEIQNLEVHIDFTQRIKKPRLRGLMW
jgi:hypothetical protein